MSKSAAFLQNFPIALVLGAALYANPHGSQVVSGSASIDALQDTLLEVRASDRSIIEWQSFSIKANEVTRFVLPNANAAVLNRVVGSQMSKLVGRLEANGKIYLVNPQGIIIGKEGVIDTAGFVASTLDPGNEAFLLGGDLSFQGDSRASVVNLGTIRALEGDVALIGYRVENGGKIEGNTVGLGAGLDVILKPAGLKYLTIRPTRILEKKEAGVDNHGTISALRAELEADGQAYSFGIHHSGTIDALNVVEEGGRIRLTADQGQIKITGTLAARKEIEISAERIENKGSITAPSGSVRIKTEGNLPFENTGTIDVSGSIGGIIEIFAAKYSNAGSILAEGKDGPGGKISIHTIGPYIEMRSSLLSTSGTKGGSIDVISDERFFASGRLQATGETGGAISLIGKDVFLAACEIDASGSSQGGEVVIGDATDSVWVYPATTISVNATERGNGGTVKIWSEDKTKFEGKIFAVGGPLGGDGGLIEVSSQGRLQCTGTTDASALRGNQGLLLLDPKNLVIDAAPTGVYPFYQFVEPSPIFGTNFGIRIEPLSNGNVAVGKFNDGFNGANSGAVYLYNGLTGALISTLRGGSAGDFVGFVLEALPNGNVVTISDTWDNLMTGATDAGAITWIDGVNGLNGTVDNTNSLVGTTTDDFVGAFGISVLTNGNYVVSSVFWGNGVPGDNVGAVSFGSGTAPLVGDVGPSNSLIGATQFDSVGDSVEVLSNGNYVVISPDWQDGSVGNSVGAVTWGDGNMGTLGPVSSTNSLIGGVLSASDRVGSGGIDILGNGNYVVCSPNWNDPAPITDVGAATFVNGATGLPVGLVTTTNSLVGSSASDNVASSGAVPLLVNNHYVVRSPNWDGAMMNIGAATWGDGTTGISGPVTAGNSLIGVTASDNVSSGGIIALTDGNYVVCSPNWDGAMINIGAATWRNGFAADPGTVLAGNSVIGFTAQDRVGSSNGIALTGVAAGNYVIQSPNWINGGVAAGAATWALGGAPSSFVVGAGNSLVGGTMNDLVGSSGGTTALSNGNYIVRSQTWDNPAGPFTNAGFVCLSDGTTGLPKQGAIGLITSANSLVGDHNSDSLGNVAVLSDGNYVVYRNLWSSFSGFAAWASSTTGIVGTVSAANALIGLAGTQAGTAVTALLNGNYVVRSALFNTSGGAITLGMAGGSTVGTVSMANSLYGAGPLDSIGSSGVLVLSNGDYLVQSPLWDNPTGPFVDAGASTPCSASTPLIGAVTSQNSVAGQAANTSANTAVEDTVNGTFCIGFSGEGSGIVRVGLLNPNQITYPRGFDQTITMDPSFLTNTLNAGTSVAVQASNDVTINTPIVVNNPLGDGGALSISAGRSVLVNANITTDNGSLTLVGNDLLANGVIDSERDPGNATVTIAAGVSVDTGTGNLTIDLLDGSGKTNSASGDVEIGAAAMLLGNTISINAAINNVTIAAGGVISGQHVTIEAGKDISAPSAATIHAAAVNSLILVVDNLFPTPPDFGSGKINLPNATITTGGGKLWIFTVDSALNQMPATINGVPFSPGPQFVNSTFEKWATYFPNGSGGFPYTVFYKLVPPPSPSTLSRGIEQFYVAITESFGVWDRFFHGGFLNLNDSPPYKTFKRFNRGIPSLVYFERSPRSRLNIGAQRNKILSSVIENWEDLPQEVR